VPEFVRPVACNCYARNFLTEIEMAKPYIPPPSDDDLLEYIINLIAHRKRAKVTVTIEISETRKHTLSIDKRGA
jgi:hypothetical protein